MMTASDVIELYRACRDQGVVIWIDGGWAVDALLHAQTRSHSDLDIAVQQKDLPRLHELLARRGYADVPRGDTSSWNFVLGDSAGHEIDVHVIGPRQAYADHAGEWAVVKEISDTGCLVVRPDHHVAWRRFDLATDPAAELRRAMRTVLAM